MPASYVTVAELRTNLGIGTLYSDADVEEVCQASQDLINQFLWFDTASVISSKLTNNVATLQLANGSFSVGDVVTVSGCGSVFNGAQTVTGTIPWTAGSAIDLALGGYYSANPAYTYITFAKVNADLVYNRFIPYGTALGVDTKTVAYAATPLVREAAMILSVDIWQARQVSQTGGVSVDGFSPNPYRMGNSLIGKIRGLLSGYISPNSMVG